ncbi:MAG: hypothetical protein M1830_006577 [Pleopsidium flavum]|nr:MAG: hypothetical protein M1830_006577 [Pleopsidium flavum]
MAWSRLIRFLDDEDNVRFGEPIIEKAAELVKKLEQRQLHAMQLVGDNPFALSASGEQLHVKRLLGVLTPADVPIIRCIGLTYIKHKHPGANNRLNCLLRVAEEGRKPPPYPSLFIKPSTCIASFDEDIPIPIIALEDRLDYEGELVRTGSRI